MRFLEAISQRINNLIKQKEGVSANDLAKQNGINRSTFWKIINPDFDRVKTAKLDTFYDIVVALDIKLKDFFDDPVFDQITD